MPIKTEMRRDPEIVYASARPLDAAERLNLANSDYLAVIEGDLSVGCMDLETAQVELQVSKEHGSARVVNEIMFTEFLIVSPDEARGSAKAAMVSVGFDFAVGVDEQCKRLGVSPLGR